MFNAEQDSEWRTAVDVKRCEHHNDRTDAPCGEIFGNWLAREGHRSDDPTKRCRTHREMEKAGLWRGMGGIWWAFESKAQVRKKT